MIRLYEKIANYHIACCVLIGAFSLFHVVTMYAQSTSCAQNLRLARATYDQGRLHEVPQYLENCTSSAIKQERVEAYKLLCLTYIYLEEPQKADEAMLNLLRTDHYFELSATDPAEFVALYRTFRTKEIYRIGASLGVNASQPNVVSTFKTISSAKSQYKYQIGIQFGASADLPISEVFTVNAGLNYQQRKFELTSENDQGDGDHNSLLATESQTWISLPVTAQYRLIKSKYNPYVGLGISAELLLNDNITGNRSRDNETSVEDKSFDLKPQRNSFNVSAVAALGAKTRIAGGYVVAELRYLYGITKVNDEKTSYNDQEIYLSYGMPNSIFKMSGVSFTIGYVHNMFNPKKLRK